VEIVARLNESK
jgi:hypothetical protein